jgi:hypothetical protein
MMAKVDFSSDEIARFGGRVLARLLQQSQALLRCQVYSLYYSLYSLYWRACCSSRF